MGNYSTLKMTREPSIRCRVLRRWHPCVKVSVHLCHFIRGSLIIQLLKRKQQVDSHSGARLTRSSFFRLGILTANWTISTNCRTEFSSQQLWVFIRWFRNFVPNELLRLPRSIPGHSTQCSNSSRGTPYIRLLLFCRLRAKSTSKWIVFFLTLLISILITFASIRMNRFRSE